MIDVKRLRFHREAHGLTQTELARRIGITQTHYSRIEKGSRGASQETLEAILQVLDVPISEIWDSREADDAAESGGARGKTPSIVVEYGEGRSRTRCTLPPTPETYAFLAERMPMGADPRFEAIVNLWNKADEGTKEKIFAVLFRAERKDDPPSEIGA